MNHKAFLVEFECTNFLFEFKFAFLFVMTDDEERLVEDTTILEESYPGHVLL